MVKKNSDLNALKIILDDAYESYIRAEHLYDKLNMQACNSSIINILKTIREQRREEFKMLRDFYFELEEQQKKVVRLEKKLAKMKK